MGASPEVAFGFREEVRLPARRTGSHGGDESLWIKSHRRPGRDREWGGFTDLPAASLSQS